MQHLDTLRRLLPSDKKLRTPSGGEIGEWRSDGGQTIISGIHPEGMPYQLVSENPVITLSYKAIIWPPTYIMAPDATESNRVRRVGENEVVVGGSVNGSSSSIEAFTGDLISELAPTDFHQNNATLIGSPTRLAG